MIESALRMESVDITVSCSIINPILLPFFCRYLTTFKYIHLRAQEQADRRDHIDKEYVWPLSFPDCTPQLRQFSNKYILTSPHVKENLLFL